MEPAHLKYIVPEETVYKVGRSYKDTIQYDDSRHPDMNENMKVRAVTVYHDSRYVLGLHTEYTDVKTGSAFSSGAHINRSWNWLPSKTRLVLEDNEYIVKLEGRSGGWMDRLTFTLSSGRVFTCPEGGNGGSAFSFTAPQGTHFSAFSVGIGGHLHNISAKKFKIPQVKTPHPFEIDVEGGQHFATLEMVEGNLMLHQSLLGQQPAQIQMRPTTPAPQERPATINKMKVGSTYGDTRVYDDMYLLGVDGNMKVHSITLYHCDRYLRGIKTKYIDLRTGQIITSGEHLNRKANWFPSKTTLTLADDEHIVKFEGRSGGWMDRLTLTLSSGRVFTAPFNGNGGRPFSFTAPAGHCFSGLAVGIGGHLHNVEMRLFRMPTSYMRPIIECRRPRSFGARICQALDDLWD